MILYLYKDFNIGWEAYIYSSAFNAFKTKVWLKKCITEDCIIQCMYLVKKKFVHTFQQEEKSLLLPYFLIFGLNLYRGLRGGGSCGWDLEDVVNWKSVFRWWGMQNKRQVCRVEEVFANCCVSWVEILLGTLLLDDLFWGAEKKRNRRLFAPTENILQ